jgi:hypothetical protein
MTEKRADESYDVSVFQILADELPSDGPDKANGKIKRTLRRRMLGEYDQQRVDALRRLRDELKAEIQKFDKSAYFVSKDRPITEHFDFERMVADFGARYPSVESPDIRGVIGYALYYDYFR